MIHSDFSSDMPTRQEILERTKEKYPQYRDVPDDQLAVALSAKYPAYSEALSGKPRSEIQREFETFSAQKKKEGERDLGERVSDEAMKPLKMAASLLKIGKEGFEGVGDITGEASTHGAMAPIESARNFAQTGIEAGTRLVSDPANLIREKIGKFKDEPVREILKALSPVGSSVAETVTGRKRSEGEIEKEFERELVDKAYEEERKSGMAKSVPIGKASDKLASALPFVAGAPAARNLAVTRIEPRLQNLVKSIKEMPGAIERTSAKAGFLNRTTADLAMDIIKPSTEAEKAALAQAAESGIIEKPFQSVAKAGKWSDMPTFIKRADDRLETLGKRIDDFVKDNDDLRINAGGVRQRMTASIRDDPLMARDPDVAERLQINAGLLGEEMTLKESVDLLRAINREHKAYFKSTASGKERKLLDAQFESDEILRKFLSNEVDSVISQRSPGVGNFYREYGGVSQTQEQVMKRYYDLKSKRGIEVSKGIGRAWGEGVELTKPISMVSPPVRYLRGGEEGRINRRLKELGDKIKPDMTGAQEEAAYQAGRVKGSEVRGDVLRGDPEQVAASRETLLNKITEEDFVGQKMREAAQQRKLREQLATKSEIQSNISGEQATMREVVDQIDKRVEQLGVKMSPEQRRAIAEGVMQNPAIVKELEAGGVPSNKKIRELISIQKPVQGSTAPSRKRELPYE